MKRIALTAAICVSLLILSLTGCEARRNKNNSNDAQSIKQSTAATIQSTPEQQTLKDTNEILDQLKETSDILDSLDDVTEDDLAIPNP